MSALVPFLTLDQTCEQVDAWARQKLLGAGLRVVPTFDLQAARLAHPDCPCPHHGTGQCNCQMMILLVYDGQGAPATLVLHGQDGRTWLALAVPAETRTQPSLEASVRNALVAGNSSRPSPIEQKTKARSAG